ncbi:MAG: hypothetical protein ACPGQT_10635, partial [Rhodothermales bacterium]
MIVIKNQDAGRLNMLDDATMSQMLQNDAFVDLLWTVGIIILAFVMVRISHRLSRKYFDVPEQVYRSTKSVRRMVVFLAVVSIALVWSPGFGDLLTL